MIHVIIHCTDDEVSQAGSHASSNTESLFDMVYEISVQEEELRQDLSTTDSEITRLTEIIEETKQKLESHKRKRKEVCTINMYLFIAQY